MKTGIDLFRIIAALLVISSHTGLAISSNPSLHFFITEVCARLAVPFFFLTAGYFTIRHYSKDETPLYHAIRKTMILYGISILLYLPLNIYNGSFQNGINLWKWIQKIVFDGTLYHLWYLPALLIGNIIAWFSVRKTGFSKALVISGILFLIGLCGDSWYGIVSQIPIIRTFYDTLFTLSEQTRNGLFFAPLYIVIGGWIHENNVRISRKNILYIFLFLLCLLSLEAAALHTTGCCRYSAMYLFQPVTAAALFLWVKDLHVPHSGFERDVSMIMYLIHPWMIVIVRAIAKLTHTQSILNGDIMQFVLVSVLSLLFGILYHYAHILYPQKKKKGNRNTVTTDTKALLHNIHSLQKLMHPDSQIMAVIKADAYGHDAYTVSTFLESHGIQHFAVATIDEAIALRHYGITSDILILGYTDPLRIDDLHRYHLTQTLIDETYARNLNAMHQPVQAHIAVDTGMHRIGVNACDHNGIQRILSLPFINVTGIFTHLCVSDSQKDDDIRFTEKQIALFDACVASLPSDMHLKTHVQSSSGLLNYPHLHYDYVRLGISMYGVKSADEVTVSKPDLRPVLSIHTKIVLLRHVPCGDTIGYGRTYTCTKDSVIAVLPIGYADGIPRSLSNHDNIVLVHDTPVRIVGRICMDQMMIDVTDIQDVCIDDPVRIMPYMEQAAIMCDSISNELLSRLSVRS